MNYDEEYALPNSFLQKYPKNAILRMISDGKRIFVYPYTINSVFFSAKVMSRPFILDSNENTFSKRLPYIIITILLGFWFNPSGIMFSIQNLSVLFKGGIDITEYCKEQCSPEEDRLQPLYNR